MTAPNETERRIREYLQAGPTQLPDRSFDDVRLHIERTHQRVVVGPWRDLMPGSARLALVAASIVAICRMRRVPTASSCSAIPR